MPTATKNAAERTRLANFSLSLTPIIYILFISGYKYELWRSTLCRAFLSPSSHFIFFVLFCPKKRRDKKNAVCWTPRGD